jgi:hypothetical protein
MPARFQNVEAICERKGRFGKVKFTPTNVMGTAISGRQEVFRSGRRTMAILTLIFKSLIPDWPVIIGFSTSMDVSNVVELSAVASWEPEQDLSQDAREIELPPRIVEEMG